MDGAQHTIEVSGSAPICQRLWKVPIHQRALIEADLDRMLANQVIKPTKGPLGIARSLGKEIGCNLEVLHGLSPGRKPTPYRGWMMC